MTSKKFGIIGCGKVGKAFINGFEKSGVYSPNEISVATLLEVDQIWAHSKNCTVFSSNVELVQNCDIIMLLVRPEVIAPVCCEIAQYSKDKFFISVAAGVKLSSIEKNFPPKTPICRVMINLQIEGCLGTSAIAPNSNCTNEHINYFTKLMSSVGYCTRISENDFDTFTALAGSGPAFIYGVIEALAEGATLNGLPRRQALEIAASMVKGSGAYALQMLDNYHPCQLREAVCTPGGSSIQGVRALENAGFRAAFIAAIDEAVKKNQEFSQKY